VAKIRGQFFFSLFLKVVYSNLQGFKILEGLNKQTLRKLKRKTAREF
jgi:hypothetical protein